MSLTKADDVPQNIALGIIQILLTFFVYSLGDLFTKLLTNAYSVPYFLLIRNTMSITLMGLLIMGFHGWRGFKTNRPYVHLVRSFIVIFLSYGAAYAFKVLPFSTAYLIIFSAPIWTAIMGRIIFKEAIDFKKWLAIIAGFIGVAITLDLKSFDLSFGLLAALLTAIMFSVYSISSRYLDKSEPAALLNFYAFIPIIVVSGFHSDWPTDIILNMTPTYWSYFALAAGASVLGGIFHGRAFQNAPASTIAPLHYTQLLYGLGFDLVLIGTVPGPTTWVGGSIIILSGLYLIISRNKVTVTAQPT